ncbi:MAG: hypothetical protein CMH55_06595, partial [Myxococcales bacterium]|nr:hypothetical protein [Myxococcales bacterium]
ELGLGETEASAATTCLALRDGRPGVGSGTYWINPDGTARQVRCDMDFDGGGWTEIIGPNNPHNFCGSWLSNSGGSFTCDATRANLEGGDRAGGVSIRLNAGMNFTRVRFIGNVYSSGGTGSPCWDWPDSDNRSGAYRCHGCGDNRQHDRTHNLPGVTNTASWYSWSDFGNVCGGSGSYWRLSNLWIR